MRIYSFICVYFLCLIASAHASEAPKLVCQQKWKEMEFEGMKIHLYRLRAEAFPQGNQYQLMIRTVDGATTPTFNYVANAKGHLIVNEPSDVLQAAPYIVTPLRRGERVGYGMRCFQDMQEYYTDMVPFPNKMVKGKLQVFVDLLDINGLSFICRAVGFEPKESVQLLVNFADHVVQHDCVVSATGTLVCPIDAQCVGSGDATLKILRAQETVSLSFPWGKKAGEFVGASCLEIK